MVLTVTVENPRSEDPSLFVVLVQAARELVLEVIREKDGDFRSGRSDFGGRLGGANLDVRSSPTNARHIFSTSKPLIQVPSVSGRRPQVRRGHRDWPKRRDDQEDSE